MDISPRRHPTASGLTISSRPGPAMDRLAARPACPYSAGNVQQLWMFWLVPLIGALVAGLVYRVVFEKEEESRPPVTGR
jgi:H+/Cl- antiporter ClcA